MKTTSLKTSELFKEAGVECESEFVWVTLGQDSKEYILATYQPFQYAIPAYTLQELVPVLKELGRIKGWGKICDTCERKMREVEWEQLCGSRDMCDGSSTDRWLYIFLKISGLYATQGMEAVDEYLINLLK